MDREFFYTAIVEWISFISSLDDGKRIGYFDFTSTKTILMHHQLLRFLALLFIVLVILQSILGGALFIVLAGWNPHSIAEYYSQKSLHGLIETLAPHTLFISIALMGSLHFLGFISTITEKKKQFFIHLLFGLFVIDQSAPIFVALGIDFFAMVKLVAFISFECALGWFCIVMFRESLQDFSSHHSNVQS